MRLSFSAHGNPTGQPAGSAGNVKRGSHTRVLPQAGSVVTRSRFGVAIVVCVTRIDVMTGVPSSGLVGAMNWPRGE